MFWCFILLALLASDFLIVFGLQAHFQWKVLFLWGFPGSSAGTWNAGDPLRIPRSGSSPREGIGYLLQYSWASLVAQMVKSLPAIRETWVQSGSTSWLLIFRVGYQDWPPVQDSCPLVIWGEPRTSSVSTLFCFPSPDAPLKPRTWVVSSNNSGCAPGTLTPGLATVNLLWSSTLPGAKLAYNFSILLTF